MLAPYLIILSLLLGNEAVAEETLKFALVPKESGSSFFLEARDGCKEYADRMESLECIFKGDIDTDFRRQDAIIQEIIDQGIDGIAISAIRSDFLAKHSLKKAHDLGIPIVTFDSDLEPSHQHLRKAFIGTNNYQFGKTFGRALKRAKPQGGIYCVMTGVRDSPNLSLRIKGLHDELTGISISDEHENNSSAKALMQRPPYVWKQHRRCPLYNSDDPDLALSQMIFMLREARAKTEQLDAIVSVGGWPQWAADYEGKLLEFLPLIKGKEVILLHGDTLANQLPFLSTGYSHGNIGQQPRAMGALAIEALYKIVSSTPYETITQTPVVICTPSDSRGYECTVQSDERVESDKNQKIR